VSPSMWGSGTCGREVRGQVVCEVCMGGGWTPRGQRRPRVRRRSVRTLSSSVVEASMARAAAQRGGKRRSQVGQSFHSR